jgi:hypothetical protein
MRMRAHSTLGVRGVPVGAESVCDAGALYVNCAACEGGSGAIECGGRQFVIAFAASVAEAAVGDPNN